MYTNSHHKKIEFIAVSYTHLPWGLEHPYIIKDTILIGTGGAVGDIVIPDGVTEISPNSFAKCDIYSVSFPDSVTTIGESAFSSCKTLFSIEFSNNLSKIESNAFKNCTAIKSLVLPDSLIEIGYYAFSECDL